MRVAVLGLGEAGSIYAADLPERGASVIGTDLHLALAPASVAIAADVPHAVRGADIVLSLVGASSAASVLDEALPAMRSGSIYADMNTSGPDDKRRLAAAAAAARHPVRRRRDHGAGAARAHRHPAAAQRRGSPAAAAAPRAPADSGDRSRARSPAMPHGSSCCGASS